MDFFFKQARHLAIGDSIKFQSNHPHVATIAHRAGFERDAEASDNWIRRSIPKWAVTWARVDSVDMDAWHDLFESSFGYRMSAALAQWKYAQQQCLGMLVYNGDKPVAFYGGLARKIHYFGDPRLAVQICDVMVHPRERGVLTRNGPFFLATASFLENKIGLGKEYLLGFGFPAGRHMQIAEKMKLYQPVGELLQVTWPAAKQPHVGWRYSIQPLSSQNLTVVNRLWEIMSASYKDRILGIRDSAQIKHRYFDHPLNCYQVWLIRSRWTRQAIGVIVCREHAEELELVDIIAPLNAAPFLIQVARDRAVLAGKTKLYAWLMASDAKNFCGSDGVITSLDISVPTSIWDSNTDPALIKDKWWLMAGDSDFR